MARICQTGSLLTDIIHAETPEIWQLPLDTLGGQGGKLSLVGNMVDNWGRFQADRQRSLDSLFRFQKLGRKETP